jgi:hypothetical protein
MSLKQNLLKKRSIDRLAQTILGSLGTADSPGKVDRESVRELLGIAGYRLQKERDLDLYLPPLSSTQPDILVLDNDLAFYRTTRDDIALRKSPTIKEMISIRNAIRILNDKDVVLTKKARSVDRLHQECLQTLDLTITQTGLEEISATGTESLAGQYREGVEEAMMLFADLLDYQVVPGSLVPEHCLALGKIRKEPGGRQKIGPVLVYDRMHHRILWIPETFSDKSPEDVQKFQAMIEPSSRLAVTGDHVFRRLQEEVWKGLAAR